MTGGYFKSDQTASGSSGAGAGEEEEEPYCASCGARGSTAGSGATSSDECICEAGYFVDSDAGQCVTCPSGTTTSGTGAVAVGECDIFRNCYVFIDYPARSGMQDAQCLNLGEVQTKNSASQIIPASTGWMSSTYNSNSGAEKCFDGSLTTICHSLCRNQNERLRIDYDNTGNEFVENLNSVVIHNRADCCTNRAVGANVYVGCAASLPTTAAEALASAYLDETISDDQSMYTFDRFSCQENCAVGQGCGNGGASRACQTCPVGTYSATNDPYECLACEEGLTTTGVGSSSEAQCGCGAGLFREGSGCVECAAGE